MHPAAARIILLINCNNQGDFLFPRKGTTIVNCGCGCVPLYLEQILLRA